ncbi:hypothetical protein TWF506_005836 [Arthrobotrys conoides]|uniref:Uncharacterized protein n=1 Tax=Arthrobotrys conoides TaxID=74498 RepID=A0AAN8RQ48_9PEZI
MSSPPHESTPGDGSPAQKKTQAVPIVDTSTTPKKRGGPPPLPSTPPSKGNSPTRLPTTPSLAFGSPGSPFGSPKPQFMSKSSIPGRWLPSYPEDSISQPGSQATQPASSASETKKGKSSLTEMFHSIKNQNNISSTIDGTAQNATDPERTSPKLPSSSSSGSSLSRERTPPFTIYEEAAKPPSAPKSPSTLQAEPNVQAPSPTSKKVPAILEAAKGYELNDSLHSQDSVWGMKREKPKSPGTLRRMLAEAQDRERVDDELVKMHVIPPTAPAIGLSGRSPRHYAFPSFPVYEGPKSKPFAPDDMVLRSMADIPQFLVEYKPKEVRALFGNYIASCDSIENMACPMRIGQLSIFIPIKMRNGEIITVGLAPAELFHTGWKGTGSPVPFPDRSIIGKRAYAVIVQQPLPADFIVSRSLATPTGNTQGTVIGIVGSACILRVEKWFLRSDYFRNESRVIPVMGELPDKPKLVLYNSPRAYDQQKAELDRMALERQDQGSRLSVKDLGGTFHQIPKGKTLGWDIKVLDFGPIGPPKHLSVSLLGGEPEPRSEPKRVPWGNIDNGTANDDPDEKAVSILVVSSSTMTEGGTMMGSELEAVKGGEDAVESTDRKKEVEVGKV